MGDYRGVYIRDTLNDTGSIPSKDTAPTYSPDVICYQKYVLPWSAAKATYGQNINMPFIQNSKNNIYIRAKNIGDKPLSSKVRAFYANVNIMFIPSKWKQLKTSSGETEVALEYGLGFSQIPPGEVALSSKAFWLNKLDEPNIHTCMFGMCQDEKGAWPDIPEFFRNNAEMWEFLRYNPNMAYNNIKIQYGNEDVMNIPVDFGNHDPVPRKFVISVTVREGLDSFIGSEINLQCTDLACNFNIVRTVEREKNCYLYEIQVPARFVGSMDFICLIKSPDKVECALQVENYLIIEPDENVIVPSAQISCMRSGTVAKASKVGDFSLLIVNGGIETSNAETIEDPDSLTALQRLCTVLAPHPLNGSDENELPRADLPYD